MADGEQRGESIGRKLIRGSAWMIGMRWSLRFIGLASTVIVARLLMPADFGIFAIAITFISLLDALTDVGVDIAIIRHPNPERRHYDTAWTFSIVMHVVSAICIALAAPLAVYVYDDSRYLPVLMVMALSLLINGFTNIGIADFRRNMEFHKDFRYTVSIQIIGVAVTLALAFLLRSYWALVLGGLARSAAQVVLSYRLHSYRPRPSLAAREEMLGFSFWTMIRSVAIFLMGRGNRLVIGGFFTTTITGWYAIAGDLAQMIVYELLFPIGRALLPGLATMQGDADWERRNLAKIFNGIATIAVATGFGLSALAEPALAVLYGANFVAAWPLLSVLAIESAISGFTQPVGQLLIVRGRAKELAILYSIQGLAAVGTAYLLASHGAAIITVAYGQLVVGLLSTLRLFFLLRIIDTLRWQDVLIAWIRPLVAGSAMYGVLWELQHLITLPHGVVLILGIPLGGLVFCGTLAAMWLLTGRPSGIEEEIHRRIFKARTAA